MKNTLAKKLKQVPAEYLVVGIDPHKKKHAAVAICNISFIILRPGIVHCLAPMLNDALNCCYHPSNSTNLTSE